MKIKLLITAFGLLLFNSCKKSDTPVAANSAQITVIPQSFVPPEL